MKRCIFVLLPLLAVLSACGTAAQYSSQAFQDGIYHKSAPEPVELYSQEDFESMAAENLARKQQKEAMDSIDVTYTDVYPGDYYWDMYFSPFPFFATTIGYSHSWNNWYWSRWHRPWISSWYDPWGYSWYGPHWGWNDPWYWYEPWAWYGPGWGWYDPWYGPGWSWGWGGHHHGFYGPGGIAPEWRSGNVYFGSRNSTQPATRRSVRAGSGASVRRSGSAYRSGGSSFTGGSAYRSGGSTKSAGTGRTISGSTSRSSSGYSRGSSSSSSSSSYSRSSGSTRSYSSGSSRSSSSGSTYSGSTSRSGGGSHGGGVGRR